MREILYLTRKTEVISLFDRSESKMIRGAFHAIAQSVTTQARVQVSG
jgi:hypothetical protein